jgi:hypothetical protein
MRARSGFLSGLLASLAATQLGVGDEMAEGVSRRLTDRSIEGNAARNRALETALAGLREIDPIRAERRRRAIAWSDRFVLFVATRPPRRDGRVLACAVMRRHFRVQGEGSRA